ncbi:MAG: DEAD/DEAH box helicase [Planctomycetes bacterium]|nr:DEAD/DEAH box helicase [Planctomycetota bacterium]
MPLSKFHPAVAAWFTNNLGAPTPPQVDGWPCIAAGGHTLIAAPTGSGKTLAAFLWGIDSLVREGRALPDETRILYISPLKALSNDVQKNLTKPLAEIAALDASLPDVRVLVRTGDTAARDRAKMSKVNPHILVTTPESFYILLTSASGRAMLQNVRVAIIDELHALARDKRGAHLLLSLERLDALAGRRVQRVGLSATQRPIERMARFLSGGGADCKIIDSGHRREMQLSVETPAPPLAAVCSHEQWDKIYNRIVELCGEHRTVLAFVNTRKLAERLAARLGEKLGAGLVACHHGSLSRARRLEAEQKLKNGELKILVATASLELGIDIGDVDLSIQIGAARSIATFIQRAGRAGHGVGRVPIAKCFPLTLDELAEAAALLRCAKDGMLDEIRVPEKPLDILAQQIVAECVAETRREDDLFQQFQRAYSYRKLTKEEYDSVLLLHSNGRDALLHRDLAMGTVRATKRAKLRAITSGGAIADTGEYKVELQPEGTIVGSVHEDFAVEASAGDIFQLGTASWKVIQVIPGKVKVADARGMAPTIPFWIGEAPARTAELSAEIANIREEVASRGVESGARWLVEHCLFTELAAGELANYICIGAKQLGAVPTQRRIVAERFFDETGGMQIVIHSPFGGRVNRAFGYTIRKRICRGFGFELQAAANEEAIVLSLGPQTSFETLELFQFAHPDTARALLTQAILPAPMFGTRWRWNASRALMLDRMRGGKPTPIALQRMFANDLLVKAFPQVLACGETLPPGDLPIPLEHPLVRQTVEDCLQEAMDADGFINILRGLRNGNIERAAVDTKEASVFAQGILAAGPYAFLDDAPLEERRTQAASARFGYANNTARELGILDADAVTRVREQAWPRPRDADELLEALSWMGYMTPAEAGAFDPYTNELLISGRAVADGGRIYAFGIPGRDPKELLRGRLCALGPILLDDPRLAGCESALAELEQEGFLLRFQIDGMPAVCERGLLARVHYYTLEKLRRDVAPVAMEVYESFLKEWRREEDGARLEGPRGALEILRQFSGTEAPAARWEREILPLRLLKYERRWLDEWMLSGQAAWARLWGAGAAAPRVTPISIFPREHLELWLSIAKPAPVDSLSSGARAVLEILQSKGALFAGDLAAAAGLLATPFEAAVAELIGHGMLTTDSFAALRWFFVPPSRRKQDYQSIGRLSLLVRRGEPATPAAEESVARILLKRHGILFRQVYQNERVAIPWFRILRVLRTFEARGEARGGRFVIAADGEQYALPEAVPMLRNRQRAGAPLLLAAQP